EEDATMAATFGLEPPPRPAGTKPTSFADVLRRAERGPGATATEAVDAADDSEADDGVHSIE
ncbi:MAG TPA: hypothetical protein VFH51_18240, partial [Myxococcota bacterium]|nr:hypothetical protein [Myxococcota bacterium]